MSSRWGGRGNIFNGEVDYLTDLELYVVREL